MLFHVYAHDQGQIEWCECFKSRAEARAWIIQTERSWNEHPSWYDLACPWFHIEASTELDPAQTTVLTDQLDVI